MESPIWEPEQAELIEARGRPPIRSQAEDETSAELGGGVGEGLHAKGES